jgi:hypothetical protein
MGHWLCRWPDGCSEAAVDQTPFYCERHLQQSVDDADRVEHNARRREAMQKALKGADSALAKPGD